MMRLYLVVNGVLRSRVLSIPYNSGVTKSTVVVLCGLICSVRHGLVVELIGVVVEGVLVGVYNCRLADDVHQFLYGLALLLVGKALLCKSYLFLSRFIRVEMDLLDVCRICLLPRFYGGTSSPAARGNADKDSWDKNAQAKHHPFHFMTV